MSVYRYVDQGRMNPSWQGLEHEWIDGGGVIVTIDLIKESDKSYHEHKFTFTDNLWEEPWYKQQEIILNRITEFVREGE